MREVDRLMVKDYGNQMIQMMENAGHKALSEIFRIFFGVNHYIFVFTSHRAS